MRKSNLSSLSVIALVAVALAFMFGYLRVEAQTPVGTGFTYQGRMFDASNAPVQGTCDLALRLYDHDSGGAQIGATVTITSVAMTDGYFDVAPDFGAPSFDGDARWLEIESACPPGAGATTFPRQAITAVPYAIYALNSSSITSTVYVTETVYYTPSYHLQGWETITGTPASYTPTYHLQGWETIIGTPEMYTPTYHLQGWATITGTDAVLVRTTVPNIVGDSTGDPRGQYAVDLQLSRIDAGQVSNGNYSGILSGLGNTASGIASGVLSGLGNTANGNYASVLGGRSNLASGVYASVFCGYNNTAAGDYSAACGRRANTGANSGVFVWADSTDADYTATAANQFAIRARGGLLHSYDDSNGWIAQVSNAGAVTFDAVGESAGFNFSDNITVTSGKFLNTSTDGNTGGIRAGSASDVLWYRGAANTWRTPDSLIVDNYVDSISYKLGSWNLVRQRNAGSWGIDIGGYTASQWDWIGLWAAGTQVITVTSSGIIPNGSNTYDLGSAANYWATIHYHTLTSHSLSVFSTTVVLQDGREVSCLDALKEIKADPTKKIKGESHMDYATIPSIALNAAPITGFDRMTMTPEKAGEDGADLDMMVSLVLCAEKELDSKSNALDNKISDLDKRLSALEQKVK